MNLPTGRHALNRCQRKVPDYWRRCIAWETRPNHPLQRHGGSMKRANRGDNKVDLLRRTTFEDTGQIFLGFGPHHHTHPLGMTLHPNLTPLPRRHELTKPIPTVTPAIASSVIDFHSRRRSASTAKNAFVAATRSNRHRIWSSRPGTCCRRRSTFL